MSKKAYGGIATELSPSGVAKSVTKLYGEVGGVARKVIKGYCEVGGVAHQFWPAENTTVGARTDLTPGGTYELNTCLPVMAMKFALEFIRKLQKPLLNNYSIYTLYQEKKSEILADFLRNLADNNIVYITCSASSYSEGSFVITYYLGKAENLNRQIDQVYTPTLSGNTYATIVNSVATQKSVSYSFNLTTKTITRSESQFSSSFTTIGLEIDYGSRGTYAIGHNVRITNLGMTMYRVDAIARGDWLWRFDFGSGMYDQIDHLKAFAKDGTESTAIGEEDYVQMPAFIWEPGRVIKVKCENFSPYAYENYDLLTIEEHESDFHYYDRVEYDGESAGKHYYKCYYRVYPGGNLVGIYVTNASQYSTGKRGFNVTQTTKPCARNQYVEQKGKIRWVDLSGGADGDEIGDMRQFMPNLNFDVNIYDTDIRCIIGQEKALVEEAMPITNWRYPFRIGNYGYGKSSNYALYGYRITEVEVL